MFDYYRTKPIRDLVRPLMRSGDVMIYRDAFRWADDASGHVMPNHFEGQDPPYLAEEHGYEVLHHFNHVAIVRRVR